MKTTVTKLRRTIRRIIRESSDWYDEEKGYETLADKKFADAQQSGLGPIRISGAGSGSFSFVLGQNDFFQVNSYDDDFEKRFVDKLLQAQDQGYENVILGADYLTIDEMIDLVREIEADMKSE